MTKRQQRIHAIVQAKRLEILQCAEAVLAAEPVGYSTIVRLFPEVFKPQLRLLVTKVPDGFSWMEYQLGLWGTKRYAAPKPRML